MGIRRADRDRARTLKAPLRSQERDLWPRAIDHDARMAELTGSVEALIREARQLADAMGHAMAGTEHPEALKWTAKLAVACRCAREVRELEAPLCRLPQDRTRLLQNGHVVAAAGRFDQVAHPPRRSFDDGRHFVWRDDQVVEPRTDKVAVATTQP